MLLSYHFVYAYEELYANNLQKLTAIYVIFNRSS